ncbi:MAG: hypothetical protein JSS62_03005 [Verrucomicrobia bacterium]|nr:hypothetical protein [Verrucomicrobiota bacterium]MBS0646025.1 hypothetical protein [Verrucomicrobiota bacterium]
MTLTWKKILCALAVITCLCVAFFSVRTIAAPSDQSPTIQEQHDQTDVYAIPLDSSEEEAESELQNLQGQPKPQSNDAQG